MEKILAYLKKNVREYLSINLMAAKGREAFYEKFGFFRRPTGEYGYGMAI
jgi:hypothetical protein